MMKNYWKPTPKKWRQVGDSILAVATFVTAGGLMQYEKLTEIYTPKEIKLGMTICLILGVTGKFLTNFFKEDENKQG